MELLKAKTRVVLLIVMCCSALFATYWIMMNKHTSPGSVAKSLFVIPKDKIARVVLDNGMHVIVFKNEAQPKVLVQIAYDVGSYVEDSGERGMAHLVEHMIFKGTDTLSETDIDTIARKYGASMNAFTSTDVTSYYFETNKNNWKPFLAILADCMQNARFDEQHLASELKAVIQELKMNKDNFLKLIYIKALEHGFPPNHPYHTPTIGYKEDLLNLTAAQVKAFYKKYYRPDRATLFIVGDVTIADALAEAQKIFGGLKADRQSTVKEFPQVVSELVTTHTKFFEDIKGEHLAMYWVVPGHKHPAEQVLSCVEAVLGAGQAGRLHRALVDEQCVAAGVGVMVAKLMEAGIFLISIDPLPGKGEACVAAVRAELLRLAQEGVGADDLARIAKIKTVAFSKRMLSFGDLVYDWMHAYFATRDELHLFKRINLYQDITSQDVQDFAKGYLDPYLMHQIDVLPLPEDKKEHRQKLKEQSDALDQKILAKHQRTAPIEAPRAALGYPEPTSLDFAFPQPERTVVLANGLTVLLTQRRHAPLIGLACQFKDAAYLAASKDGGRLDMMMDMLMEGSKRYSKNDNVDFFEQRGAAYGFDAQGAVFSSLAPDFEALCERFSWILQQPTFPKDALKKLQDITVDNYERAKDSPKDVAVRLLKNVMYKDHAYAWTFDEMIASARAETVSSLRELHGTYVNAENMVLSVVGDFELDSMESMLKRAFAELPAGTRKLAQQVKPTSHAGETIDYPMLRDQVVIMLGRLSPVTIYDPDRVPLKLLSSICYRSLGSRIYKVRERTGLFYTAFGDFASGALREPGFDYVGTIVSVENVDKAEQEINGFFVEVAQKGVTQEELSAAKVAYQKDLIDAIESNTTVARMLCTEASFDLGFDYYDQQLKRMQALTVDDINAVAARYARRDGMIRVRVGRV